MRIRRPGRAPTWRAKEKLAANETQAEIGMFSDIISTCLCWLEQSENARRSIPPSRSRQAVPRAVTSREGLFMQPAIRLTSQRGLKIDNLQPSEPA